MLDSVSTPEKSKDHSEKTLHMSEAEIMKQMIQEAFEQFNLKSQTLTQAYQELKKEVARVNMELEHKNQELEQAGEFLNKVFQGMMEGIMVLDSGNRIIKTNQALLSILGCEEGNVSEKQLSDIPSLSPLQKWVETCRRSPYDQHNKIMKAGDKWLELSGTFFGKDRLEFLLVVKDLTEVKDLRKQLIQSESLAGLGQMAVTVAHEIRNPLGGIEGFAALLKRDLSANSSHLQLLDKIISGVRELNAFITALLTFSKPVKVNPSQASLDQIVDKVILYSGKTETEDSLSGIKVLKKSMSPVMIHSDSDLIRQAVLNLLLNAYQILDNQGRVEIEFSEIETLPELADPLPVRIIKSFDFEENRRHVLISVRDSGPGIPIEVAEKMFKPFFTTKAFGTGIGLSMVQKITEALEGKIEVFSCCPLGGAEFKIYLPDLAGEK
ncbi:MAG: PAS domain-containing protein [Candidatus Aureabacteria bacterium]|nr:PAS domain-containing protein [Candidatus Auribacterota bacterium]